MARQLAHLGKPVQTLILLDARVKLDHFDDRATLSHFIVQLSIILKMEGTEMEAIQILDRMKDIEMDQLWDMAANLFQRGNLSPPGQERKYIRRYMNFFKNHIELQQAYEVKGSVDARVVFIHSTEKDSLTKEDVITDWQSHFSHPIEVYPTSGSHLSMIFNPKVSSLASILKNLI